MEIFRLTFPPAVHPLRSASICLSFGGLFLFLLSKLEVDHKLEMMFGRRRAELDGAILFNPNADSFRTIKEGAHTIGSSDDPQQWMRAVACVSSSQEQFKEAVF